MPSVNIDGIQWITKAPIPLCFSQENFRKALSNSNSLITTFKNALEVIDSNLNFRFREGENIRTLITERAQLIDCLAVEHFMHDYYRVILSVQALNDVLLQYLDEAITNQRGTTTLQPVNSRFRLKNKYIQVTHDNVFKEDPSALLEIFVLAANIKTISGIRASTIRLIREHRYLIDDNFRRDKKNCALFLQLMASPIKLVSQLQRMKRYGILGRYLPEFNHTIGQMQHDLFHIYTVDAHTLNTIRFMREMSLPDVDKKYALAGKIAKKLPKPALLYITGLYHDIGKGRDGDHSVLGAEDAIAFGERHGISKRETHFISWLVRNHLLMSFVSQKKDISDPDVIFDFAKTVGTKVHLDYLYVLTVAIKPFGSFGKPPEKIIFYARSPKILSGIPKGFLSTKKSTNLWY